MSSAQTNATTAGSPAAPTIYDKFSNGFHPGPAFESIEPLKTHNHLLGNQAALEEAWEKNGYWFFRDVLDKGAIGRLRKVYVDELKRQGVVDTDVDASSQTIAYNGADQARIGAASDTLRKMEPQPWKPFVAEPGIHDFFAYLFGEEPVWFPSCAYRTQARTLGFDGARFGGVHADATPNPGVPARTCWIPLVDIDEQLGGLVLAESQMDLIRKRDVKPLDHDMESFVPVGEIPPNAWRRADFHPGDLLMMNCQTPHCGLSNESDLFRLSVDIRVLRASDNLPIIGDLAGITVDSVTISQPGGDVSLKITDDTYVRNPGKERLLGQAIIDFYSPGMEVIVGRDGDIATLIRPST